MSVVLRVLVVTALALAMATAACAQTPEQPAKPETGAGHEIKAGGSDKGLGVLGLCVGAALTVLGGALGISHIGAHATESIARQPEAAGSMFLAWLLPAAMIEGAMLFGVLVCFQSMSLLK